ncbi:MAG: cytochrome c peroxidase [Candidatus Andeanibacterium colombiense]|uniref:Cytochrome c peroxidase n=1 Tax=Candidatus Andeanibacterium colombiense TaxID=3121345 RepID=A0AAJ6BPZ8_9SPHN|nr:MAG: cytochrome c peroxidase [Sphingomonadaceae bacterium]
MRASAAALIALAALALLAAARPAAFIWNLPDGVTPPPVPSNNPMSAVKVELGRRLFYDADLSIDGTMSCATCHEQHRAFADGNRTMPGVHGDPGRRNVPGLANVGYLTPLTWADPRLAALEAQAAVPVFGETPVEMGMKDAEAELPKRLGRDGCYRSMFRAAFPKERGRIDGVTVAKALAAFQRTLVSYRSPYDRGEFSPAAQRGKAVFGQVCAECHSGANLTDGRFHALESGGADVGLAEISGNAGDRGKFRTPSLRNAALTAPYFHDGSAATLDEALRRHGAISLTAAQRMDIFALLGALTDKAFVSDPRFAYPESACGKPL